MLRSSASAHALTRPVHYLRWSPLPVPLVPALRAAVVAADAFQAVIQGVLRRLALQERRQVEANSAHHPISRVARAGGHGGAGGLNAAREEATRAVLSEVECGRKHLRRVGGAGRDASK